MSRKTIPNLDVSAKRVLIRVDFNVPMDDGVIGDDRRIRAALATIRSVVERDGRAILLSHLGRPAGTGYEQTLSLKAVAERLSELLGKPVGFPGTDCVSEAAAAAVEAMVDGDIVLLENLRFHAGEKKGEGEFAAKLAVLGDVYVNDAFGTSHRRDASMVALPRAMQGKPRVSGMLLDKEMRYLSKALANPARPFVVVLGGAKVGDKIGVIENLMSKSDATLIGGAMAYTFVKALGHRVGDSKVEESKVAVAKKLIDEAARLEHDMHIAGDHVCSTQMSATSGNIEVFEGHIEDGFMGLDIGPQTQSEFARVIRGAKTIVWNGPMGVFEMLPFRVGTKVVAKAIAEATDGGATSIVGGGDSAAALETFELGDRMTHVSTGGGASLELLAGNVLESVELLDEA